MAKVLAFDVGDASGPSLLWKTVPSAGTDFATPIRVLYHSDLRWNDLAHKQSSTRYHGPAHLFHGFVFISVDAPVLMSAAMAIYAEEGVRRRCGRQPHSCRSTPCQSVQWSTGACLGCLLLSTLGQHFLS